MQFVVEETIDNIATKGDVIHLNPDHTWEVKKQYTVDELLATKSEIEKMLQEQQQDIITKSEFQKNDKAWQILTKLYDKNLINVPEILKSELMKMASCKDITKLYEELMLGEMGFEGFKGDSNAIEKIINSCKSEGGNVGGGNDVK